jgi:hypothetical protein
MWVNELIFIGAVYACGFSSCVRDQKNSLLKESHLLHFIKESLMTKFDTIRIRFDRPRISSLNFLDRVKIAQMIFFCQRLKIDKERSE